MAQPAPIFFKITEAGKNAALDAESTGLTLRLDSLGVGRAQYTPTGGETALRDEFMRVGIAAGDIDEQNHTLRFSSTLSANSETEVWELGLFDEHNRLFAVASRTNKPLLKIYPDIVLVASFGLTLGELDLNSITMVIDPSGAILAAYKLDELYRIVEQLRNRPFEGIPVGGILTTSKHYNSGDEVTADLGYGKWQRFAQGQVLAGFSTIGAHDGAFKTMGNEFGAINKTGGTDYHVVAFWQRMPDDWGDPQYGITASANNSDGTITFTMTRVGGADDVTLSQVVNGGAAQDVHVHFNGNSAQHVYRQTGYGKSTVSLAFVDYPHIAASATVEVAAPAPEPEPEPVINSVPLVLQWRKTNAQNASLDIYADEGAELWLVIPSNINGKVELSNLSVNDSSGKLQPHITWYETQDSLNAKNLVAGEYKIAHYQLDDSGDAQDRHDVYSDLPSYFSYSVKLDQTNTATLNITRDRPVPATPSEPKPPIVQRVTGTAHLQACYTNCQPYYLENTFAGGRTIKKGTECTADLVILDTTLPNFNYTSDIHGTWFEGTLYDSGAEMLNDEPVFESTADLNNIYITRYANQTASDVSVKDGSGNTYTVAEYSAQQFVVKINGFSKRQQIKNKPWDFYITYN